MGCIFGYGFIMDEDQKRLADLIEAGEPSAIGEIAALLGQVDCAPRRDPEPPIRISLMDRIRALMGL